MITIIISKVAVSLVGGGENIYERMMRAPDNFGELFMEPICNSSALDICVAACARKAFFNFVLKGGMDLFFGEKNMDHCEPMCSCNYAHYIMLEECEPFLDSKSRVYKLARQIMFPDEI